MTDVTQLSQLLLCAVLAVNYCPHNIPHTVGSSLLHIARTCPNSLCYGTAVVKSTEVRERTLRLLSWKELTLFLGLTKSWSQQHSELGASSKPALGTRLHYKPLR